jgi:hypothetical protein
MAGCVCARGAEQGGDGDGGGGAAASRALTQLGGMQLLGSALLASPGATADLDGESAAPAIPCRRHCGWVGGCHVWVSCEANSIGQAGGAEKELLRGFADVCAAEVVVGLRCGATILHYAPTVLLSCGSLEHLCVALASAGATLAVCTLRGSSRPTTHHAICSATVGTCALCGVICHGCSCTAARPEPNVCSAVLSCLSEFQAADTSTTEAETGQVCGPRRARTEMSGSFMTAAD